VTTDDSSLIVDYEVCESQPATPGKPQQPAEAAKPLVTGQLKSHIISVGTPTGSLG